jgi:glycosyltransferase involved in cell wall biosynthesis
MNSSKVSILLPTHNRATLLPDALRSALAQTYTDLEILVLDNASADNTPDIVAAFQSDPRVRSLRHAQDLGITGNWRAGIEAATGDFFCLLHDDDTLEPEFVTALLTPLLADESLALAFSDHRCMDAQGQTLPEETEATLRRFRRDCLPPGRVRDFARTALVDTSIPVGASLFRRSTVTPEYIDARALGSIDMWLLYGCWKSGMGAYYVPQRLMNYRLHGGGMSHSQPLYMAEGSLFRYDQMLADPGLTVIHTDIQRMRAKSLTDYGIGLLDNGRIGEARRVLRQSLSLRRNRRTLAAYVFSSVGRSGKSLTRWVRRRRSGRS